MALTLDDVRKMVTDQGVGKATVKGGGTRVGTFTTLRTAQRKDQRFGQLLPTLSGRNLLRLDFLVTDAQRDRLRLQGLAGRGAQMDDKPIVIGRDIHFARQGQRLPLGPDHHPEPACARQGRERPSDHFEHGR